MMSPLIATGVDAAKVAIDWAADRLTWGEFYAAVAELAAAFDDAGVGRHHFVVHATVREPDWPLVLAAAVASQRVWLPAEGANAPLFDALLRKTKPEWVVVDAACEDTCSELLSAAGAEA